MIPPVFAQAIGGMPGGGLFELFVPLIFVFGIFYLLVFRPQQKRMKEHQERIGSVRRGDIVVTSGGIVGKVIRVGTDNELKVEIAEGVQVRLLKTSVTEVRGKTEPLRDKRAEAAADNDDTPAQPTV